MAQQEFTGRTTEKPMRDSVEQANANAITALRELDHARTQTERIQEAEQVCGHAADLMEQTMSEDEKIIYNAVRATENQREWGLLGEGVRRWYAAKLATTVYRIVEDEELDALDDAWSDYTILEHTADGRTILRNGTAPEPILADLIA